MSRYHDDDREDDGRYAWHHDEEGSFVEEYEPPPPKRKPRDGARRRKKFATAAAVLEANAALVGRPQKSERWWTGNGRLAGLYVFITDYDEMTWTPRGGYVVRAIEPIPF